MVKFFLKIWYILSEKKAEFIWLVLLFLLVSILEAFGIGLIGPFLALASEPASVSQSDLLFKLYGLSGLASESQFVASSGLVIVFLFCLKSFVSWLVQARVFTFSYAEQGRLVGRLMHAYFEAPYTFHLSKSSSGIVQNVVDETRNFSNGVLIPLLTTLSNVLIIVSLIILLAVTNLVTLVVTMGSLLPLILLFRHFQEPMKRWGQEASQSNEEIIRIIGHGLGGIKESKVIGCEQFFEEKIQVQAHKYVVSMGSFFKLKLSPRVIVEAFFVIFLVGFTSFYLLLGRDIQQLTATLSILALAAIRLIPATSNFAVAFGTLRKSTFTVNKLYLDLQELESELSQGVQSGDRRASKLAPYEKPQVQHQDSAQSSSHQTTFNTEIFLDGIEYRYPNASKPALDNISLRISKGESIALIGKSGAGKTTLVDLILGLISPQQGDIKVDGVSVTSDIRLLQSLVGYIPQSIFLVDDTLKNNIAFGVPETLIDYERLDWAIRKAQLKGFIKELPDGLETMVGERGVRFSGGQRQRVGIARALYHEREILVLDEATAALDNETESLITEAIDSLSGQKTMITIAHRLTTVRNCDRIYLMENGRIVKSGSYEEIVLNSVPS